MEVRIMLHQVAHYVNETFRCRLVESGCTTVLLMIDVSCVLHKTPHTLKTVCLGSYSRQQQHTQDGALVDTADNNNTLSRLCALVATADNNNTLKTVGLGSYSRQQQHTQDGALVATADNNTLSRLCALVATADNNNTLKMVPW